MWHKKKKPVGHDFIRLRTMTLEEGLEYLRAPGQKRKIEGHWVENKNKPSMTRLHMFATGKTKCVECGLEGSIFHIERHRNDTVMPFSINLYALNEYGAEVMMTWDHILPKSLGGSNDLVNAQCMCKSCNEKKGNSLSLNEMIGILTHEDYIKMNKIPQQFSTPNLRETIRQVEAELEEIRVKITEEPKVINTETIAKSKQADFISSFWTMLQECETKADSGSEPVLKHWVEAWYKQWNDVTGDNKQPAWLSRKGT